MPTKATKKFQNKKLKGVLEKRKTDAKVKQKKRLTEKKKARRQKDRTSDDGEPTKRAASEKSGKATATKDLKDMTVDEFFQDGLDIPDGLENTKRSAKAESSVKNPSRKRKRSRDAKAAESQSDDSGPEQDTFLGPEAGEDSQSEDSIEGHKGDLEALAEKDPEFYKYLRENDAELLDFSDNQELKEPDEAEESEEPAKKKKRKPDGEGASSVPREPSSVEVTVPMVEKWENAMQEQHSLRATKELLLAFRSAAHASDLEERDYKYAISSPEVYHRVLVATLSRVPDVLEHHLHVKALANGRVRVPTDSKKYSTLSPVLNAHCSALAHLLGGLSDAATLKLTLTCLLPLIPYFLSFKKSVKALLKVVLDVWSDTAQDEATRVSAFLLVRRFAVTGDPSIREAVLKSTYQALIRGVRTTTVHTLAGINLMKNSAAELWSLDPALGYTTGFAYIRQLAVHLRPAIAKPSADAHRAVYNWQFVHALDFWSRALAAHCALPTVARPSDSPLHPLVYPVVQLCLATARLIPAPHYFPLRFHCARALLRLGRAAHVYIPLAPLLLEVLRSPELTRPAKPSTLRPLDFRVALRAPAGYLRTRAHQDGAGEQVVALLAEFFGTWARSVAFPELVLAPSVLARRWLKEASGSGAPRPATKGAKAKGAKRDAGGNRNGRLNAAVSLLLQKLAAHAAHVESLRRNVTFAPNDRREVENFMRDVAWEDTPLGAYVQGMRARAAEKETALEEGRRAEEKQRRREQAGEPQDEEREQWRDRLEVRKADLVGDGDGDSDDSEDEAADELGGSGGGMNGTVGEGMGDGSSDPDGDDEDDDDDDEVDDDDEDGTDGDEDDELDGDAADDEAGDEEESEETKKAIVGIKRWREKEAEEGRRRFRDYNPGFSNLRSTSNDHE